VQLALDAVDRLVDHLEERGSPLDAMSAARLLFATRTIPEGLATTLVAEILAGDPRLSRIGSAVALAGQPDPLLEESEFVVFDLETTGLSAASSRICEIGAVRVHRLELADEFQTLVDPRVPLPTPVAQLTGLRDMELRRAPRVATATRRFLAFARDATLTAHNARFDLSFLDRQLERECGRKRIAPAVDTVALARRLLDGRLGRANLSSLSVFFGTAARPCHRALPDAQATAEILIRLIGLAQERGARTLGDLHALAAPRERRVYGKRSLAHGAPSRPGVYLFRDRHDQVLYVGKARDLRARLRSYFRSERQRPAVEAALAAVERIEWRLTGSELEAALAELQLIRELRPPANARGARPDRYVYLGRRDDGVVVSSSPTPIGPITSRRRAHLAARALQGATAEELDSLPGGEGPLPRLRLKLANLADCLRYEDAARLRDRISALEDVLGSLRRQEALRAREACLLAPAVEPGWMRAVFLAGGRVDSVRSLPPGPGARLEVEAGIAAARAAGPATACCEPETAGELVVVGAFLRRPPPEIAVLPLRAEVVLREVWRRRGVSFERFRSGGAGKPASQATPVVPAWPG
jgi:DNA polymerase III subunit epsilon